MFCGLTVPSISGRTRRLLENPAVNCKAITVILYLLRKSRTLLQGLEQFFGFDRHFRNPNSGGIVDGIADRRCDRENAAFAHPFGAVRTAPAALLQDDGLE